MSGWAVRVACSFKNGLAARRVASSAGSNATLPQRARLNSFPSALPIVEFTRMIAPSVIATLFQVLWNLAPSSYVCVLIGHLKSPTFSPSTVTT